MERRQSRRRAQSLCCGPLLAYEPLQLDLSGFTLAHLRASASTFQVELLREVCTFECKRGRENGERKGQRPHLALPELTR